jgi:hemerythrin-like domain-containing protein
MTENKRPDDLPGFDEPLALLRACHEKILAHCDLLEGLIAHMAGAGPDSEARKTAEKITRYFSTSARLHHRDEEEDLFPRLNRQSLKIAELVYALKNEHEQLETLWETLSPELKKLPGEGFSGEFTRTAADFCSLYKRHIEHENMEFLPLAANSLSQQELVAIGESMAERRGVSLTNL